jgi:hypothetical protein
LIHQHQQQTEIQRKQRLVRDRENAVLDRKTKTKHSTIPDMKSALAQAQTSPPDYPEEYKDFIKRTSGHPV